MASGVFIIILTAGATPHLLGWFTPAATGIPVGDALIVLRSNGPKTAVYNIHGATAVVMPVISVLLCSSRNRLSPRIGRMSRWSPVRRGRRTGGHGR